MKKLKSFLPTIYEGEHFILILLFIHAFLNGLSLLFFETTANTLFLMTYDTTQLPYVYIVTAIISVIFGFFYGKIEEKLNVKNLLRSLTLLVLAIIVIFYLLLEMAHSNASAMGIMIFKDMVTMVVGIGFGILTSTIFDIRQGKRLFGLLVSGEILAGMVGGVCVGSLLEVITTTQLLVISACSMFISFLLLNKILKLFATKFDSLPEEEGSDDDTSYGALLKNSYYRLFFIVSLLAFFVFYFIDYIFYLKIEEHYTNEKDLANFFGIYYALLNGVNLISSLFVSGKLLSRFGISIGLLSMPIIAVVGTSSLVAALFVSVSLGFLLLVILKLMNEVIDISILTPSFRVLYQSMPANQKNKVLAFRETIIEPSAMGIAGVLLVAISFIDSVEIICIAIALMGILWYTLGSKLINLYVVALKKLFENRYEIPDEMCYETINKDVILEKLKSENDIDVLYALEMLFKIDQSYFDNIALQMLRHKSPRVRLETVHTIKKFHKIHFLDDLKELLLNETNEDVLCSLIDTYGYLGRSEDNEVIINFIENPNDKVQNTAISTLMKYGGIDGMLIAGKLINNLLDQSIISQKVRALNLLSMIGISGGYRVLLDAMKSDHKELKCAAIQTIGHLKIFRLVDILFETLKTKEFKVVAFKSLVCFGDEILQKAIEQFNISKNFDEKAILLKVMVCIKNERAYDFVLSVLDDELLFIPVIDALAAANYHTMDKTVILKLLETNIAHLNEERRLFVSLNTKNYSNTQLVLREFDKKRVSMIFQILYFYYHKHIIFKAKAKFLSNIGEQKAFAIELLDNLLDKTFKTCVLNILENSSVCTDDAYEEHTAITTILKGTRFPIILKISAIYEIGKSSDQSFCEILEELQSSEDSYIQETLAWTNDKLSKGEKQCY